VIAGRFDMTLQEKNSLRATNPPHPTLMEVEGQRIEIDAEGYLVHASDWSRAVTASLAERDAVELGEDHWLLIDFLHRFYAEYEIAPDMPILSRNLCKDQQNCRWTRTYIKQLFPNGAKMACRYAGLPAPVGKSCL
jgi:TusE/DsrC/DsvC family sulfur relay protein